MRLLAISISGFLLLVCPWHSYCFPQEVDIGITKQRLTKIKIGVNKFTAANAPGMPGDATSAVLVPTHIGTSVDPKDRTLTPPAELANKLSRTLISDLTLVDYFEPVESNTGIDLILNCSYNLSGQDQLIIEGKLYETKKGQMLLGKRFSGLSSQYRKLIHSLTDSIITTVTGEKGICQTRLSFEGSMKGNKQILISDFDGANVSQLTKDPCPNLFPNWSPEGSKIVYTSYLYNFPQTFIFSLKEGTRNKLYGYPGLNTSASFSSDGRKIALTLSKDGNPEIYTTNTNGTGLTRITNDKSVDTSPCWSPDSTKIAFVSNRGGSPQIYTVEGRGGTARRLTYTGSYNTNPNWSPKGDTIVYNSIVGGVFQIFTIDVTNGEAAQITESSGSCENPSFAPDGRHIVFSLTKRYNSALYIMDIFFRELHKLEMRGGNYTNPDWGK